MIKMQYVVENPYPIWNSINISICFKVFKSYFINASVWFWIGIDGENLINMKHIIRCRALIDIVIEVVYFFQKQTRFKSQTTS